MNLCFYNSKEIIKMLSRNIAKRFYGNWRQEQRQQFEKNYMDIAGIMSVCGGTFCGTITILDTDNTNIIFRNTLVGMCGGLALGIFWPIILPTTMVLVPVYGIHYALYRRKG